MQNWDALQPTANYDQHNNWYNSMFAANIKTEPDLNSPTPNTPPNITTSHLEQYLKQHHHHHQQQQHQQQMQQPMDTLSALTPSPGNNDSMQHFFDNNNLQQQQLYQQQFHQAQQAAAQNQVTSSHLPLGFNPLTPPGLPTAVLPSISQFYNNNNNNNTNNNNNSQNLRTNSHIEISSQQNASQQQSILSTENNNNNDSKLQAALTPRNTPPMDVTPPKSPKDIIIPQKSQQQQQQQQEKLSELQLSQQSKSNQSVQSIQSNAADINMEKEHDLQSNSSEDIKYMIESEDDDTTIRMPIYNSHGKMKNYKCKSCGMVAITKVAFWEHASAHMKPEKILQCPKCPFVTELKHHLEYHIRKHKNLKPFQCDKCSYTCVNKSMLNSHRKSHSSVYQYRCSDCDYATKYCHSFKLHLRKYEHKPGLVLDEEGLPNPSVVIDVYGTRRGPKNKNNGGNVTSNKRHHERHSDLKMSASQLSAALQGFTHQLPASPAKSTCSNASERMITQQKTPTAKSIACGNKSNQASSANMSSLLPPLASILQQNRNMAFFPYWNLNLQMFAAQQQAAVLAQLSPRMRETALQQLQLNDEDNKSSSQDDETEEVEDDKGTPDQQQQQQQQNQQQQDEGFDRKSVDSAMDLSQGTPIKEEHTIKITPEMAMNLKLQDEANDTPLLVSTGAARRKGRVLKLETKSASQSPEQHNANDNEVGGMPAASSSILDGNAKIDETNTSADESMENGTNAGLTLASNTAANTSSSSNASAASSSGNSSNGSNTSSNSNSSTLNSSSPAAAGAIYECKYCDIYFKDAVLYTIHMGYHSCDDVFKCNMCGEKCDGPVGLFVHMARNAHS